jgi:UPF0755 protein
MRFDPPRRPRLGVIFFTFLIVLITLAAVAGSSWFGHWIKQPLTLSQPTLTLVIAPGSSAQDIANEVVRAGVQTSPWLLYQWFRWSGLSQQMRSGHYQITQGQSPSSLLDALVRGGPSLLKLRFTEGWTFGQMRAELARTAFIKHDTAGLSDADVMTALGAPGTAPEGRFFPDTYLFSKGSSELAVLQRAYKEMQQRLEAVWAQRAPDTPLRTMDEALTLASIVEKETAISSDRSRVAGVFINRLRIKMPLQTDPSVIYGIGPTFDGNLRKRDLQADTPFNTYTRAGLPPTPIAMPGQASLLAVMKPQATKALYFVARGDGSSEFSETLAAHNRAVQHYQRASSR